MSEKNNRPYPWGDAKQVWRCNSAESGWGRPVNVFDLPEGNTPEGVFNLFGNVFEWLNAPGMVRGGSWCTDCDSGRSVAHNPNEFDGQTGFRYVSAQVGD